MRPLSKNLMVYGENASGKSSFVDAIEYILAKERIEHQAHEYSGHKQLLGIRNTHTPDTASSRIRLDFEDNSTLAVDISPDGEVTYTENPDGLLTTVRDWDLMRTVLRQDKVADFIHATKREKYSQVLPLLGLETFETAAENLRKLRTEIEDQAKISTIELMLDELVETARTKLGTLEPEEALRVLQKIAARNSIDLQKPTSLEDASVNLKTKLAANIGALEPAHQRHVLLKQILDEDLEGKRRKVKETRAEAFKALDNQIEVLVHAGRITEEIAEPSKETVCPACGKSICAQELREHIDAELTRLHDIREMRDKARTAVQEFLEAVKRTLLFLKSECLKDWLSETSNVDARKAFDLLGDAHLPDDIDEWTLDEQVDCALDDILLSVKKAVSTAPPHAQNLFDDLSVVEVAMSLKDIDAKSRFLVSVKQLCKTLEGGEENIRHYIRSHVEQIVSSCSSEIQRLWAILHPNEPIQDIHLASNEDKAVDIALKFFGKTQSSPRLTLSEGHRNSLSLCIFLALAHLTRPNDNPIALDDIVSSLDRGHRGRIVDLLEEEFKDRQILLFTHDREWYAELRSRLSSSRWTSCTLKPYISPEIGIQLARSDDTFDDARSIVDVRPESAGNTVRSIMDYECALAAESLQISVRFRRGDENDRRSCIEFLDKICAEGRKRLRRDSGARCDDVLQVWNKANGLLKAWANRASHAGSLAVSEANELIDACENAVKKFRCDNCEDPVWVAEARTKKRIQCGCGKLYWDLS